MLTAAQIRAARAMLRWTAATLALRSGVARYVIYRLERSAAPPPGFDAAKVRVLRQTFEAAGIRFLEDNGTPRGGPGLRDNRPAR